MDWVFGTNAIPQQPPPAPEGAVPRVAPQTVTELRFRMAVPTTGAEARDTSAAISRRALAEMLPPSGGAAWHEAQVLVADKLASRGAGLLHHGQMQNGPGAQRFQDVATGMRLRYREWGDDDRTVIVLHDTAANVDIVGDLCGGLAAQGFYVVALDQRGHGDSASSSGGQYTPEAMAADLESFVLERDLYARPVILIGFGIGAAIAATFAARSPRLVAAAALVEYSPESPADQLAYHYGQAAHFMTPAEGAGFLAGACWGHDPRRMAAIARHLHDWIKPDRGPAGGWRLRMDPMWRFAHSPLAMRATLAAVRCPLLLLRGQKSHFVSEAAALATTAAASGAPSVRRESLAGASHFILEDAPRAARDALARFVRQHESGTAVAHREERTPEALALRPLPTYNTLEEAAKALGPRRMPTAAAVAAALVDASSTDEAPDSDTAEERTRANRRTALLTSPLEYFGMVG